MTSTRGTSALPWVALGVLGGLVLALGLGIGREAAIRAQAVRPVETAGTIAFTAAGPGSTQLLYLIDTRAQAFAVYRVDPQELKGTVKLEAAPVSLGLETRRIQQPAPGSHRDRGHGRHAPAVRAGNHRLDLLAHWRGVRDWLRPV